jgi:hypothetical protein
MPRPASSDPNDPAAALRQRVTEALKALDVRIQISPFASAATRRRGNRVQHALGAAQRELRRLVEMLGPR